MASIAWADGPAAAFLARLAGDWRLERRIEDARAGATGALSGVAVFTLDAAGARYAEAGTLSYGGVETRAERRYVWRITGADRVQVAFDDGRPFHDLTVPDLSSGAAPGPIEVRHNCAPDVYDGVFSFALAAAAPTWRAEWRVAGPRKAYRSISEYQRA